MNHYKNKCLYYVIGLLFAILLANSPAFGADPVRIGVLTKSGPARCLAKWQPTADHLSQVVSSNAFEIVPLDFSAVPSAVANNEIDFILTNSSSYIELQDRYNVNSIATLVNRLHCGDHTLFGGVIFTRADNQHIYTLNDLENRDFMAVEKTSYGGWRMAWRELLEDGIDPHIDFRSLSFGGTHEAVVFAVQNSRTDAGTVRTDTLERMAAEGQIKLSDFRILHSDASRNQAHGFIVSTRLYPEWPMAALPQTSATLVDQVAQALLLMSDEDEAAIASQSAGWTYPLSYQPVKECLKSLQVGPYDPHKNVSLASIYRHYRAWIIAGGVVFGILLISSLFIIQLNTHLAGANDDLTKEINRRKNTEAVLKKSQTDLEISLVQAQAANEAKSQFLANMNHEIRTPMNGVIGMASLLSDTALNKEQRDYTQTIQISTRRLMHIINDLLDFSYMEKNQLALEISNFNLAAIIADVAAKTASQSQAKGLVFTYQMDPDVPVYLKGDPARLRQILIGLLGNAVKFTSAGEVAFHVRREDENDTQVRLHFSIQDTGIGISPERQEDIYQPFCQVDTSYTRQYGGSGLGLAIAKHLVTLMNGELDVQSIPGEGTTFRFTVRLAKQRHGSIDHMAMEANISDKRILIIDNNPISRQVLEDYFKSINIHYAFEDNAAKAMTLLHLAVHNKTPFDLAIIAHDKPVIDADAIGCALGADPELKHTRLVMLTVDKMAREAAASKRAAFSSILTRPIERHCLHSCLLSVFGELQQPNSTAPSNDRSYPAAPAPVLDMASQAVVAADETHAPRILVVEDNLINQRVVMNILKKFGYRASIANNGREAVEELQCHTYDVVLMDLQMPEMDGYEASRAIRDPANKSHNPHIPILALTANTQAGNREKCLNAGMDDYLTKPVNPKILMACIRHWLEQAPIPEPSTTMRQKAAGDEHYAIRGD